jgi:hypothetical protein
VVRGRDQLLELAAPEERTRVGRGALLQAAERHGGRRRSSPARPARRVETAPRPCPRRCRGPPAPRAPRSRGGRRAGAGRARQLLLQRLDALEHVVALERAKSVGGSMSQSSCSEVGGATVATCTAPRWARPASSRSASITTMASRRPRNSVVRSARLKPPGLRCTWTSRRPSSRASASPYAGGTGQPSASAAATVMTRPRRSTSSDTGRPISTASSAMARASSRVQACRGGTRRR